MPEGSANVTASADALAAIDEAVKLLKGIGFLHSYTSMKSETGYYGRPGWKGVIRVSTHRWGRGAQRDSVMPVAAHNAFGINQGVFSAADIERRCCEAVGRYTFARARAEVPPDTCEDVV